jgi:hypothetical protein
MMFLLIKIRSLDPRVLILWPSENLRQKGSNRDFRMVMFFLIFYFFGFECCRGAIKSVSPKKTSILGHKMGSTGIHDGHYDKD